MARDYAEAKRLFYVAATRARDRLILAGAPSLHEAYSLHPKGEWRSKSGVDHWLRYLYPAIRGSESEFKYGASNGQKAAGWAAPILRGLEATRSLPPTLEGGLGGPPALAIQAISKTRPREWLAKPVDRSAGSPPAAPTSEPQPWPKSVTDRAGSLFDRSPLRTEFGASELMQFASCDWKHHYGYVTSLSTNKIEAVAEGPVIENIAPAALGQILHEFLQLLEPDADKAGQAAAMKRALLRHRPMSDEEATLNIAALLRHAEHYLASEWNGRIAGAIRRNREVPFVAKLREDIRLRGTLDCVWQERDG